MIHPHTELRYISEEIGHGVFATRLIPSGTITWIQDPLDRELTPEELEQLAPVCRPMVETYTYRNHQGNYVLCWDLARYLNHSFRPNCMATAYGFEVAIKTIREGEQLTNDYGFLNIIAPFRAANEGTRRKTVYPDDLLRYYNRWDKILGQVLGKIVKKEQPLRQLINDKTWQHLQEIAAGNTQPESIRQNHYQP